ncbi:MAG: class I SAM-dependent methyltransferase [Gemmatimonadaceae bacterium]
MSHQEALHDAAGFDAYAQNYDAALDAGLSATGEDKEYFARGRVDRIRLTLRSLGFEPRSVMDYGCGTGSTTPLLLDAWADCTLIGVDSSVESVRIAQSTHASRRARFEVVSASSAETVDLVDCNGVFHHIPPSERANSMRYVYDALRPGGMFACCENNPWNPGTRYVMRRIPFDRDAIPISPPGARRMLRAGGFEIVSTEFLFFFPRALARLRPVERRLAAFPLGGQYIVFARKAA